MEYTKEDFKEYLKLLIEDEMQVYTSSWSVSAETLENKHQRIIGLRIALENMFRLKKIDKAES